MRLRLIRHATLLVEIGGRRVLIDPMLDPAGARPAVADTPNDRRNPLCELPEPAEVLVRRLDAVLVTHLHADHLDETAVDLLPKDVPLVCQPPDEGVLRDRGDVLGGHRDRVALGEAGAAHAPGAQVVAVHLEAINHCLQTRADLHQRLHVEGLERRVTVPEDGALVPV